MNRYRGDEVFDSPQLMDELHRCSKDILDAFVAICGEHELRYYLAAGTLLGAIRHQGPIPWDDDVDVYMPREDADTFVQIMLDRPESDRYHIQCYANEPTFLRFNYHVNKTGTLFVTSAAKRCRRRYMELWMDIFPLDEHRGRFGISQRLRARHIRSLKNELLMRGQLTQKKPTMKHRLAQIPFSWMSEEALWNYTDRLMRRDNRSDREYYVSWTGGCPYPNNVMPKSWFEPACELPYMNSYYRAPREWDKILTKRYGDYMQLPPVEQRKGHTALEIGF